jgi:DNA-binding CsgD family transcriptional regulator
VKTKVSLRDIRARVEAGQTDAEIAAALDRSPKRIGNLRRRLGLLFDARAKWPRIAEMIKADTTGREYRVIDAEIAAAVGLAPASVRRIRNRLGIKKVRQWPAEKMRTLEEMVLAGKPYREIADALGVSRPVVCVTVRKLGLVGECGYNQRAIEVRVAVMRMRADGVPCKLIAETLGSNVQHIRRIARDLRDNTEAEKASRRARYSKDNAARDAR